MGKFDSTLEAETTLHLPDHELLLSFTNDCGAEAFNDWWDEIGKREFELWAEESKEFYE